MTTPTAEGFLSFVRQNMGISEDVLPDDSIYITYAYDVALEIVNPILNELSSLLYTLAVYNLAGDNLLNYAQDVSGSTYFSDIRESWNMLGFVGGVIDSSSDESTSQSMTVPEAVKFFTLANLQQLKTPYGRAYLQIAQDYGYIWGLT